MIVHSPTELNALEEVRIGEGEGEFAFALVREVQLEHLPRLREVTVRGKSFWCTPMVYVTSGFFMSVISRRSDAGVAYD